MHRPTWRLILALVFVASGVWAAAGRAAAQQSAGFPLPAPGSRPFGLTVGPDGALWFTEQSGNRIGRITPTGAISEFSVPTPVASPFMIVAGPDGALWFTEASSNKIGRITTGGAITEYPLPAGSTRVPAGIAVGPDGALWFTEELGTVGRITTAGTVTEFGLPTLDSHPFGIVAGADGALWFTEEQGNRIGRITTGGLVNEFSVPTPGGTPSGMALGPDHAIWFTEELGNKIGRITTAGVITEFSIPTSDSHPTSITAGPDGALWFTEQQVQQIGRVTTSGQITEYPAGVSLDLPSTITAGPDGALWFTAALGNSIGRIVPVGLAPPTVAPSPTATGPGGRDLSIAPSSAGTQLAWLPGSSQTGYVVARASGGAPLSVLPPGGPLPTNAVSFVDSAPGGLSCYLVLPLGTAPQARSDALCAVPGVRSATGAPDGLTLRLNQSTTASLSWSQPAGGGPDGYAIVTLGGGIVQVGAAISAASVQVDGPTCFLLAALHGGAILGYSDVVCGIPGLSLLPPS